MKKELSIYWAYYLAIVIAIVMGISFAVGQNWWAMVWALLSGVWVNTALTYRKQRDRIEQEFNEYIKAEALGGKG